jgi:hypothetical protein
MYMYTHHTFLLHLHIPLTLVSELETSYFEFDTLCLPATASVRKLGLVFVVVVN